jgi:alkylation response protein AidB-like acyl-CoA dehydrogenase
MSNIVTTTAKLAEEFRVRAADYDCTGEFPRWNYARMREAGYLHAPAPAELGGYGASLLDVCRAQQALARGCASTALAVNMHLFQVGAIADAWRNGQPVEALLRRIVNEGLVLASNGAESIVLGAWTTSTIARRSSGGYVVNGRKFFCSQAPGFDIVRFLARDADTNELLIMSAERGAPGLKVEETWDTTGMRATASHDLVLENVELPEKSIGARLPAGEPLRMPALMNVYRWFLPTMASVYLGIAEEASDEAYRALGTGINSAHRHQALTDVLLGEMAAALLTARSVRDQLVGEINTFPQDPRAALIKAIAIREIVVSRAIAAVEKAVEIAGGRAYFRKSPLERLMRDVQAGRFHPPSAPISLQIIGQFSREAASAGSERARKQ